MGSCVHIKRLLRIMKLTIFALVVFTSALFAAEAHSQMAKISLSAHSSPLSEILSGIEKQTDYLFVYEKSDINLDQKVSLQVSDKTVMEALNYLFKNSDVIYAMEGNNIVLMQRDRNETGEGLLHQLQDKKRISGIVKDAFGEPIIGGSVSIKGTSIGGLTDIDGNFTIDVPSDATLLFSYIGYIPQEVKTGEKQFLTITLLEDIQKLDEVVIVGYGIQKRSNVTGSVASIKPDEFNDLNMGVTSAIQGRVAGVDVSNDKIIIRGAASVNGSDPLWIVDGVPGSAPNMNDIESLEILKDAASTAIYGARGAGGVILVTTKKGKSGKLVVNAKVNFGVALPIDIPKMLETKDYIDRKLAAGFANNPDSGWDNPASLPNTNWEKYVWREAAIKQNYFMQVTGGNEHTSFNTSAEISKNEQLQKNAFDRSGNIRYAGQTAFSKRFKMTEIIRMGFSNNLPTSYGVVGSSKIYYRQVPTMLPYDNENVSGGGWGKQPAGGYYEGPNPAAIIGSLHAKRKSYWGNANLIFDWEIIDHLYLQANFSGNFSSFGENQFQEYWSTGNVSTEQRYTKNYEEAYNLRMLYTLTYNRVFADKHEVKGLLGYEAYKAESSTAGGWKTGFSVEPAQDMTLGSGATEALGGKRLSRSISQFARLNYAYDSKYMVEASVRRDGYDNFGPKNRFGVFPSASVGWNVSKESFISDNDKMSWLSQLKLRASIGKIGNNTVSQFLYEPSYTSNYLYYSYDNSVTDRGFWYSGIPNSAIKWEDVTQWNIGIDASFLNNRLNTTIEYYDKKTTDMLYTIGAPPSSGSYASDIFGKNPSYMANIGEISNKGFEWMIQWRDSYKDFRYDVAFTLSTNKNKVIKLSDAINPLIWKGTSTALNSSIYRTESGYAMGQMYGYVVDGIFGSQGEVDALNTKSPDGVYQTTGTAAGDFKYKDINGDNKITEEDKAYIGNPWADIIYGLNLNFSWKNFDLTMGWVANTGMDIFNSAKLFERSFYGDFNTTYKVYDAWSPSNTSSSHPRVINTDPNNNFKNVSSYFVEDGSYLKLKNLHFGYNLPKSLLNRLNIQGLKIFVNCDNLLIFTKFQGDPEIGGGYLERNYYSEWRSLSSRSVMGGLSLSF